MSESSSSGVLTAAKGPEKFKLKPSHTSFLSIFQDSDVRSQLSSHGLCIIENFGSTVHPRVSSLASAAAESASGGGGMLKFLSSLDPKLPQRKCLVHGFSFHNAGKDKHHPTLVLDRGWSGKDEVMTFKAFYTENAPVIDADSLEWDSLVSKTLPGETLLYASDIDDVSLLSYERRNGGSYSAPSPPPSSSSCSGATTTSSRKKGGLGGMSASFVLKGDINGISPSSSLSSSSPSNKSTSSSSGFSSSSLTTPPHSPTNNNNRSSSSSSTSEGNKKSTKKRLRQWLDDMDLGMSPAEASRRAIAQVLAQPLNPIRSTVTSSEAADLPSIPSPPFTTPSLEVEGRAALNFASQLKHAESIQDDLKLLLLLEAPRTCSGTLASLRVNVEVLKPSNLVGILKNLTTYGQTESLNNDSAITSSQQNICTPSNTDVGETTSLSTGTSLTSSSSPSSSGEIPEENLRKKRIQTSASILLTQMRADCKAFLAWKTLVATIESARKEVEAKNAAHIEQLQAAQLAKRAAAALAAGIAAKEQRSREIYAAVSAKVSSALGKSSDAESSSSTSGANKTQKIPNHSRNTSSSSSLSFPRSLDMTCLTTSDCLFRAIMATCSAVAPGMTSCYTYFARAYSVFAAHAEDHNLPSINQLVFGAPKVWFAVPPDQFLLATQVIKAATVRGELPTCPQAVAHKLSIPSLALLRAHGIRVTKFIQRQGDLVITAPGAIHFGINCGDNVAESTNVSDGTWLSTSAFAHYMELGACNCKENNKWDVVPRLSLPLSVVPGAVSDDIAQKFGILSCDDAAALFDDEEGVDSASEGMPASSKKVCESELTIKV